MNHHQRNARVQSLSFIGDLFEEQQQTESDQFIESVTKELEMYKAEKPTDLESDPLE